MKLYYPFQLLMAVLGLIFPVSIPAGERPASAPPVDERLDRIEYRLKKLEAAVFQTGNKIKAIEVGIDNLDCPCPDGGVCICDGKICRCVDCKCVDCPEQKSVYGRSINGRTVQRVGSRVACIQNGDVVLYLAGADLDQRAKEWLEDPVTYGAGLNFYTQPSYQPSSYYTQPSYSSGGHYETQCSGGFCRRVWVPN